MGPLRLAHQNGQSRIKQEQINSACLYKSCWIRFGWSVRSLCAWAAQPSLGTDADLCELGVEISWKNMGHWRDAMQDAGRVA